MAQVKLADHQGAEEECTATKRYGPKGVCETLMETLSKEDFLSLLCLCLQSQKAYDVLLVFLEILQQILF